jgi:hypothetical protein
VHQRPLEKTRTPSKSCKWVGEAIVNGRAYTATSRMAPANDIARQLVADGLPDAPMQVYSAGLKRCLPGLHSVAPRSLPTRKPPRSRCAWCGGGMILRSSHRRTMRFALPVARWLNDLNSPVMRLTNGRGDIIAALWVRSDFRVISKWL